MDQTSGFQLEGAAASSYEQFVFPVMEPFVAAVIRDGAVRDGARVLDLACGTGFVARAAHGLVSASGSVVGVDVNPTMLSMAASCSSGLLPPIRWIEASATALPLGSGGFDAVLCQQGLQFVPDLDLAVDEARRVLADGGRVVATVWAPVDHSPFMAAQFRAVSTILGPVGSRPLALAFECSAAGVRESFERAGLLDVEVRQESAQVRLPDVESFVRGHLAALPWGAALDRARPDGLRAAADEIVAALDGFVDGDGVATVPFVSTIASGTR